MKLFSMSLEGKPPWQIILRGAALPGMIVAACALIAAVYALINGDDVTSTTRIGVFVGLFFAFLGVLDIVFGILISSKNIKTNSLLVLGYLGVWALCLCVVFY